MPSLYYMQPDNTQLKVRKSGNFQIAPSFPISKMTSSYLNEFCDHYGYEKLDISSTYITKGTKSLFVESHLPVTESFRYKATIGDENESFSDFSSHNGTIYDCSFTTISEFQMRRKSCKPISRGGIR